jgi:hypothetical protein
VTEDEFERQVACLLHGAYAFNLKMVCAGVAYFTTVTEFVKFPTACAKVGDCVRPATRAPISHVCIRHAIEVAIKRVKAVYEIQLLQHESTGEVHIFGCNSGLKQTARIFSRPHELCELPALRRCGIERHGNFKGSSMKFTIKHL